MNYLVRWRSKSLSQHAMPQVGLVSWANACDDSSVVVNAKEAVSEQEKNLNFTVNSFGLQNGFINAFIK